MEHLDLAGYLNTPTNWNFGAFEQQDAIYLSNSRQMLEPIMEETSEDEEHAQNSWNQYSSESCNGSAGGAGGFLSSAESDTGSVIRVEIIKDLDAMSERDFACPPKRARRSDEQLAQTQLFSLEDGATVQLRRAPRYDAESSHNSLERFLALEAMSRDSYGSQGQRNSTGSRRFDDYYSDNDSYHSLSRSSSLVQFESLERQLTLQEQHQSMNSLGNSSPSLLSCDAATNCNSELNSASNSGNNSRRGSQSSLMKRYESSDGRLHQTYYELNKLNFDEEQELPRCVGNDLFSACKNLASAELKSDSESSTTSNRSSTSSTTSSDSSGHSILSATKPSGKDAIDAELVSSLGTRGTRIAAFQARGGKNSAENLSEDSGYCEPSTLRRAKSKSIPKNFDKFYEEDEECLIDVPQHSKNSNGGHDLCQLKIATNVATFLLESRVDEETATASATAAATPTTQPQSLSPTPTAINSALRGEDCRRGMAHSPSPVSSDISSSSGSSGSSGGSCSSAASFTWLAKGSIASKAAPALDMCAALLRNSLPDIREVYGSEKSTEDLTENSTAARCSKNLCTPQQRCRGDVTHSYGLASNCYLTTGATTSGTSSSSSSGSSSAECSPILGAALRERNASVPNDLCHLGRRRRPSHSRYSRHSKASSDREGDHSSSDDGEAEERADFFDPHSSLQIRRSCSWSERRAERGRHKFEGAFGDSGPQQASSGGYLNASYQNLTLLDYTGRQPIAQQFEAHQKRRSATDSMAARQSSESSDYEGIICRGNFLLDELSQIYDKNASILNDKPIQELVEPKADVQPKPPTVPVPPSRAAKAPAPQVQHVQLTIRKPPPRQKRDAQQRRSEELSTTAPILPPAAAVISFSTFGKTFDQDPTNLRTSYAQSLEQCNFDSEELTSCSASSAVRALPKRRFHSQTSTTKQRSMVSSTPNLYSHDRGAEELDDDMYVSSAHNSMHQLPQTTTPKPLGILLPVGSRTSFSKEVSFCPVVSKYCWQEQSSEEPQEDTADETTGEDEEDELLDNVDATVIYNTKENENIAARYNEEQALRAAMQREKSVEREAVSVTPHEESDDNNENNAEAAAAVVEQQTATADERDRDRVEKPVSSVISCSRTVSLETNRVAAVTALPATIASPPSVHNNNNNNNNSFGQNEKRPLSLHLPILSEPPTNRAHHILYASQQLLDRYAPTTAATAANNNNSGANMSSSKAIKVNEPHSSSNNNELSKSRHKSDEKHPSSKGFLSRFAHGLRFSLRRKKKQQQQLEQQQQQQQQKQPQTAQKPLKQKDDKQSNGNADFIHIPLKGPLPKAAANANSSNASSTASTASMQSSPEQTAGQQAKTSTLQKLVTGKPPLPKQPPRSVHAQYVAPAASAAMCSEALLDAERQQYAAFAQQLSAGMQRQQANGVPLHAAAASSPSRASVSQKTQMFNQLGNATAGRPTMVTVVPVAVLPSPHTDDDDTQSKIGLIETNLDTHETIISGKTRSLMDITRKPNSNQQRYIVKRMHVTSAAYDDPRHIYDPDHDERLDDDDDEAGQRKISSQAGGVQIATVRRPHKSMEFLLDKENQRNVLPPENELQKSHDLNPAALSEHQLRVQASLQRLNIPDWFRQYNQSSARSPDGANAAGSGYKPGNFTRKRTQDSGRWQGLNSKTTSLSSLGSQRSDRSPLLLSPSAHSHHGGQSSHHAATQYAAGGAAGHSVGSAGVGSGATRWSTSHLNSTQTSPSVSQRGSFARGAPINSSFMSVASGGSSSGGSVLRNSYRQPYLGWRSTEKLSQRTPHERLANSLLAQQQRATPVAANGVRSLQPVTPEIQSSIKEVTSAIVHYVNDQTQAQQQHQRSRSASPNSRKCWLESSFVGTRPLDSPQTPLIENSPQSSSERPAHPGSAHYVDVSAAGAAQPPTTRMNGLSRIGGGGAPERSLSSASLEDVLASLLGLPTTSNNSNSNNNQNNKKTQATAASAGSSTTVNTAANQQQLEVLTVAEQQCLRRRSEGDAPTQKKQQSSNHQSGTASASIGTASASGQRPEHASSASDNAQLLQSHATPPRRVSLGDSSESHNKTNSGELQIKCRNTKCDQSATPADAKKLYKSCHNCTHLYCSRECRRAHWEKHRKACLHSRASNLCRQVLATCKDDMDSQRHLSLLARKGSLSQGRGVVRVLFRSAEAAEGFIKHGFQCMGEACYVRWPDLMPAEMGLELYSELLKLSTEYKPESKMLIYVAICVVSEAPGMGQAPVRWERQLVSRCAKLKLCKSTLAELELQQQALQQPYAVVDIPERTEILILTFNPGLRATLSNRELILSNILDILSRRGVLLRKHYPEIYQRLQSYTDGQTDKFHPVTLHPRDSQTGQSFVCIIMPVHSDSNFIKLPSATDGGNRVTTIDVGSPAALAQLDDDELLTRTTLATS